MRRDKIWEPFGNYNDEEITAVGEKLSVNSIYASLLLNRGIDSVEGAQAFFRPQLSSLYNPMLMKDMDEAVLRIDKALHADQKVWVYGDYDVDGTTSVTLMFSFLRQFFGNIDYYVPDREKEGYGISKQSIDKAIADKVELIIALDCGIRSVELVQYAKDHGIDFIICDHHEPGDVLPPAVAVLDPKRKDCSYPFKELSGCGIGFKLVQALCNKWDLPLEEAYSYLDLTAVSIASDLVPIVDENRVLCYHGMLKLNENPSPGLKIIIDKFVHKPELDIANILFMIGPRINAAGRIASAKAAVDLLLAEAGDAGNQLAFDLNRLNQDRKGLDANITKEALQQITDDDEHPNRKTNLVHAKGWHKGVVGIVASRIIEVHYRPTIVLTEKDGVMVGSARSIESFNIHDALESCSEYLIQFGGHKYAAGMKLLPKNFNAFKKAFEASASELTEEDLTETLRFETELDLVAIDEKFVQNLKRFAPHGPENLQPVFLSRNLRDSGLAKTLGSGHDHLRLNLVSNTRKEALGAIGFGFGLLYHEIKRGRPFDLLYTVGENHFNGRTSLQLEIKDLRFV